jgi:type II secretory pathway predicted ATPase ExeA
MAEMRRIVLEGKDGSGIFIYYAVGKRSAGRARDPYAVTHVLSQRFRRTLERVAHAIRRDERETGTVGAEHAVDCRRPVDASHDEALDRDRASRVARPFDPHIRSALLADQLGLRTIELNRRTSSGTLKHDV